MKMVLAIVGLSVWMTVGIVADATDKAAVREAVEQFLQHLGDGDFDRVADDLAPK